VKTKNKNHFFKKITMETAIQQTGNDFNSDWLYYFIKAP